MKNCDLFYSQNGEDFLIWQLFKNKADGFYIDIGADDGIHYSTSYYFEKNGWKGICFELDRDKYTQCKKNRPNSICLTSDPNLSKHTKTNTSAFINAIRQHLPENGNVAFISIDIDSTGVDLDTLRTLNFRELLSDLIIVKTKNAASARNAYQLMIGNGYTPSRAIQHSYIFSKHDYMVDYLKYKKITCQVASPRSQESGRPNHHYPQNHEIDDRSRWITPNVLCQLRHQPLWSLLEYFPERKIRNDAPIRLIHVVNPYRVDISSAHARHQQLTYESMRAARDFDQSEVTLVSVQHKTEPEITPPKFQRGRFLEHVVTDLAHFKKPQALPLLFDILERGAELAGPDDFIVYTNSDIILMPHFYAAIREFIECGFDAMNICRRTIGDHPMYRDYTNIARSEIGYSHPGSDCFVFSKKAYDHFARNNSCVGRKAVAKSLLFNLAATATRMLVLKNANLTYHIGDDRTWDDPEMEDYTAFNRNELEKTYQQLSQNRQVKTRLDAFINNYWQRVNTSIT